MKHKQFNTLNTDLAKKHGFTIVELLIVIVVVGILAAISIVAYNNVQSRARDTARLNDVASIQKALELYKAEHGKYPGNMATSVPASCSPHPGSGYSYSFATDGSWMTELKNNGYMTNIPTPSKNDCASWYRYLYRPPGTYYGCTLTAGYYILEVNGTDGAITPSNSATFRPCPSSTVTWSASSSRWVFGKHES